MSLELGYGWKSTTFEPTAQKRSFSNALKWAYAGNFGDRAISSLVTFILAGALGPRDFGVVSIALIYLTFVQMFLEQGLASALIQKKDLNHEHCNAVFWLNLGMSICCVGFTILVSGWWARVNHAPELALVLPVLAICIPIEGLSIVQSALVRRELNFRALTIRSNVSVFLGGVTGVILALLGFKVWALVGMQVVKDSSALILLWGMGHWRPKLEFSYVHLKELLSFSAHTFLGGLGTFADMQMAAVLLGILFGPAAVGLYRLGERLMNSVVSMATTSIQGVSLPEFSRLQNQPEQLKASVVSCVRLSSMVTIPALMGMCAVSGPLMATLGPKWIPATNVLRILCVQGMIFALSYFTGPLLTALGRPDIGAKLEWTRAVVGSLFLVGVGLLLRTTPDGWRVNGIALARAIPNVIVITPVYLYLLMHFARLSMRDVFSALKNPIYASLGIMTAVYTIEFLCTATLFRPMTLMVIEAAVGGAVGLGVMITVDKQFRGIAQGFANKSRLLFTPQGPGGPA